MTDPAFLLDSNICIYVLADADGVPARKVQSHEVGRVVTSSIVFAEVMCGIPTREQHARERAGRFFERVPPMDFDLEAALAYARIPFKRARFDRLIAAHALALNLTLVTNNEADFADIPGLKTENWTR